MYPESTLNLARVYLKPAFGLREKELPTDHQQGTVAEHIWHSIFREQGAPFDGGPYHIQPLSRHVTGDGGDGFTVLKPVPRLPSFRLWEVKKKHPMGQSPSSTINRAVNQLKERGAEYLAMYSAALQESNDQHLEALGETLVANWLCNHPSVGIGIVVATSPPSPPPHRSFGALRNTFASLPAASQKVGHWFAIDDFPAFCQSVKEELWTAI